MASGVLKLFFNLNDPFCRAYPEGGQWPNPEPPPMDRSAKWLKPSREGIPPVPESKATAWLGLSPQAAALAVIILLGLVMTGAYVSRVTEHLRGAAAAPTPYPHELAKVSFAVAGDVIPHEPVRASAEAAGGGVQGWVSLFSGVDDLFKGADFGFVNLETPVAPAAVSAVTTRHSAAAAAANRAGRRPSVRSRIMGTS